MVLEWFFLTIFSAIAYSMLDIMEKNLISNRIPSAVLLAIFLAVFYPINLIAILIFFQVDLSPLPALAGFAIGAGMALAYLLFMKSLLVEEVSRVVTLHYTYPLFIAPIAFVFLGEDLTYFNYVGMVLLVASTLLISYKRIGRSIIYSPALPLMTTLNIAIAVENVLAKYLFSYTNFWSFLFWLTLGLVAMRLSLLLIPSLRKDFARIRFDAKLVGAGIAVATLFLVANLFYYGAVSLQFVSLVGALSAIQPMFILAIAMVILYIKPRFVYEELSRKATVAKSVAAGLVFAGTYLLTLGT